MWHRVNVAGLVVRAHSGHLLCRVRTHELQKIAVCVRLPYVDRCPSPRKQTVFQDDKPLAGTQRERDPIPLA
jgi:hypothetical protein